MKYYFDTSALFKRYISEPGSERVEGFFMEAESIAVGSLSFPELISALARYKREKRLNANQYQLCEQFVCSDFTFFEICQLSDPVLAKAMAVLEESPLRASDAIHIASALEVKADRFISGDSRQMEAAKKFDLAIGSV